MAERYILLVSDDNHLAEEASYSFPPNFDVKVAKDGPAAWVFMDRSAPEVAIVEMRGANAGGPSLAEEMGQREGLRHVPILMLLERPQDEWLAKKMGATATRVQPIEASDLVAEALALIVPTSA